jgi:hypothetical protein
MDPSPLTPSPLMACGFTLARALYEGPKSITQLLAIKLREPERLPEALAWLQSVLYVEYCQHTPEGSVWAITLFGRAWVRRMEAARERRHAPPPPETLVGALQDRIHPLSGLIRARKGIKR